MIRNYLTVAFRVLLRRRLYSFISISGLALGIACSLLVSLLVAHERSYDRFHEHRDRIYRLVAQEVDPSGTLKYSTLFPPEVVEALVEETPGVQLASGYSSSRVRLAADGRSFHAKVGLAGPAFLRMFSFPLLAGDPATALTQPNGIIITAALAEKLLGTTGGDYGDLLGRTVTAPDRDLEFAVTGVAAQAPGLSSLEFEALAPIDLRRRFSGSNRGRASVSVYVQLSQDLGKDQAQQAMSAFMPPALAAHVAKLREWNSLGEGQNVFSLRVQPLLDVYGNSDIQSHYEQSGNRTGVQILAGLALAVLLLASSNFATLSASLSSRRAREVGIRKVLGAARAQIMHQFWGEALLIGAISLATGLALARVLLPLFSDLAQVDLSLDLVDNATALAALAGVVAAVVLLSASHVSLVLSGLHPVAAMRGEKRVGGSGRMVRGLVVMQYAITIGLLICTVVMVLQLKYVGSKSLGYDKDNVVVVRTGSFDGVAARFKEALLQNPRVRGVTLTDRAFTSGAQSTQYLRPDGTQTSVRLIRIDPDFLTTLNIDLLWGRDLSADRPSDASGAVLINESLANWLGSDDLTGVALSGFEWCGLRDPVVAGVVRDFHMDRLHRRIQPLVLQMHRYAYYPSVMVRLGSGDLLSSVAMLEAAWEDVAAGSGPIQLSFLDSNLEQQYRSEQRWRRVLSYASAMAIAISCLGLFGLASLTVARRAREIAIRKAIGASAAGLVGLMSRQYIAMLVLANAAAWPVAYLVTRTWLDRFAYRVDPGVGIFMACGGVVAALALATTSAHTVLAALRNPVDYLMRE
jgi:putative ABC transport system permease protein